jgi:hypothetical protein
MTVGRTHLAAARTLLTSPFIADTLTFLMNTWNTLLESYQLRVYYNILATVNRQVQQVVNPTPAMVICREAAHIGNADLHHYLTSTVALDKPAIGSTDRNITIDNYCPDDDLHFVMPGGSRDYHDEQDEKDIHDTIPTTSRSWIMADCGALSA